jgi:DNA-binding NtrC family response regulator
MLTRTLKSGIEAESTGFLHILGQGRTDVIEVGDFLTIGRDTSNRLVLIDDSASNRHSRIERKDQGYLLRDLRSRNGSYLNGASVVEAWLTDGDRLRIGETEILFSQARELPTGNLLMTSLNAKWQQQLDRLSSVAKSGLPALLTGPSGSGKEIIAQEIHKLSNRSDGPFVSVNCSALSESLVESELFGHVRGSFTGATGDRKGAFEAARGGTLFLDEIGDLPLTLQPKLLRALEAKQIRPVGSDKNVDTDTRIVAATHHYLKQKVAEGTFRADLYFRLHVAQIQTPALVERMEDFETLLYTFGRDFRVGFSFGAIQRLKEHSWPGNVRELKNMIARAKAYFPDRQIVETDLETLVDFQHSAVYEAAPLGTPSRSLIKEIENEMIKTRLIANKGNQRKTALDLGMPKSTLHDRIRIYGINVEQLLSEAGIRIC